MRGILLADCERASGIAAQGAIAASTRTARRRFTEP
jgi:hypothetical protein